MLSASVCSCMWLFSGCTLSPAVHLATCQPHISIEAATIEHDSVGLRPCESMTGAPFKPSWKQARVCCHTSHTAPEQGSRPHSRSHVLHHVPGCMQGFDTWAQGLRSMVGAPSEAMTLQLAPSAVVTRSSPAEGNDAAINHDLLADANIRPLALQAIATGKHVVGAAGWGKCLPLCATVRMLPLGCGAGCTCVGLQPCSARACPWAHALALHAFDTCRNQLQPLWSGLCRKHMRAFMTPWHDPCHAVADARALPAAARVPGRSAACASLCERQRACGQ